MREEVTAARDFILERIAQTIGFNGYQQEIVLAGKMFRCGLSRLGGSRKMDIAISLVNWSAIKHALRFGSLPKRAWGYLVNKLGHKRLY